MKKAVEGNVDAYNQLLDLAGQDIAVHIGLDVSGFENQFNNLLSQY